MRYGCDLVMGLAARTVFYDVIERLIGDKCVNKRAIERFSRFSQRF